MAVNKMMSINDGLIDCLLFVFPSYIDNQRFARFSFNPAHSISWKGIDFNLSRVDTIFPKNIFFFFFLI